MPDELDQLLDEALKSYSAAEPSADLPVRILRQAQQALAPQRNRWKLAFAFALSFAAAVALAFVPLGQWTLPKPPATIASAPPTPSVVQAGPKPTKTLAAAAEPVPTHRKVHKVSSRDSWARPLPPPYSKEELALLNFVQQHPKEAAEIAEAQKQDTQPISTAPLDVKPLTIAALN